MSQKIKPLSSPKPIAGSFRIGFYFLFAGAGLLYAVIQSHYRTGILNDDVIYILGARSLWHVGPIESFCLRPDYPLPGMPVLLAPFVKWVQPHWTRLEWLIAALTVGLIILAERWSR